MRPDVGKPLRDKLIRRYAARCGPFRLIYRIFDDRIVARVIHIPHRRDVLSLGDPHVR